MVVPSFTEEGHSRAEHLRKLKADEIVMKTLSALKDIAGTRCDCFAVFTLSCVTWLLDHDHEDSLDTDMFNPAYKEAMKVQPSIREPSTGDVAALVIQSRGIVAVHLFKFHCCVLQI